MKPTIAKGTKAYSYLRFSTPDQAQGDSQRRQLELGKRWCEQNGVTLVQSYADLGVSAYRGRNAAQGDLARFLAAVQSGKVAAGSLLIVESLDRLSRQTVRAALGQFLSIINAGVGIVTLADGKVYTPESCDENFTDLIVSLTVMARANEESKTKAMRSLEAWRAKRARAGQTIMTTKCVAWLKANATRTGFDVIPDRVALVREMFDKAANGVGGGAIAKDLNRRNVPTFAGARWWSISYVKRILCNRAVLGELAPVSRSGGKQTALEPIPGYYPAIVPLSTWSKVQTLRAARPSYRGRARFNPFSHLVRDVHSGQAVYYINKNRARGMHYMVPCACVSGKAPWKSWRYDDFLGCVLLAFSEATKRKVALKPSADPVEELRGELADLDTKVARLVEFLANGTLPGVDAKLRALEASRVELQNRIATEQAQQRVEPIRLEKIDWQDTEALRDNLRAVVKMIHVDFDSKEFVVECLDGRKFGLARKGDKVIFTVPSNN